MDKKFEAKYHILERDHWWSVGRRDIILKMLEAHRTQRSADILEIGCSSGMLLSELRARGFRSLSGVDVSEDAVAACKREGLSDVEVAREGVKPFGGRSFDVVIASDILEHIDDDRGAIKEWGSVLRPGGILVVFVPAFMFLWGTHDVANCHFRRYTRRQLVGLLEGAGLAIERSSYWNAFPFIPKCTITFAMNLAKGRDGGDHFIELPRSINSIMTRINKLENRLIMKTGVPFGVSVFAVGRKPGGGHG